MSDSSFIDGVTDFLGDAPRNLGDVTSVKENQLINCLTPSQKIKHHLSPSDLTGVRIDKRVARITFFLLGKLPGQKDGTTILYDSGASATVFLENALRHELKAAPVQNQPPKNLVSIGGNIQSQKWEVELAMRDQSLPNIIQEVWSTPYMPLSTNEPEELRSNVGNEIMGVSFNTLFVVCSIV